MCKVSWLAAATLFAADAFSFEAIAETCSERRAICLAGEKSRAYVPPPGRQSSCITAHPICIRTGIWDTMSGGPFGQRIEGLTRRLPDIQGRTAKGRTS